MQATRTIDPSPLPAPSQAEADIIKTPGLSPIDRKQLLTVRGRATKVIEPLTPSQDEADLIKLGDMAEPDEIEVVPRSLEVDPPTPTQAQADLAVLAGMPEPRDVGDPEAAPNAQQDPTQFEADSYKVMSSGVLEFITAWDHAMTFWDDRTTVWDRDA
jgi:hypothetical protein